MNGKRLIVSPLDWGLGHAARMVPVIKHLSKNNKVYVVCGKNSECFLKAELPEIEIIVINDLKFNYSSSGVSLLDMLSWIPKMLINSAHEHFFVKKIIKKYKINAVFSDNRYGLLFRGVECYFFTHQIFVLLPKRLKFFEVFVHFCFIKYLSRFEKCLIPDFSYGFGVSGILSEKKTLCSQKFLRVGILSRFNGLVLPNLPKKFDFLVLLSGCENQRTVLENILFEKFCNSSKKINFVRGCVGLPSLNVLNRNIKVVDMLSGADLLYAFATCEMVVCRSGYSTVCDLIALKKRAILIATPGQTEQEYLAQRLDGKFGFVSVNQDKIKMSNVLE